MEKIARIYWNTHDWKLPSGREGKTENKDAYEVIVGFGHEEWLLDDSKILPDGYHYPSTSRTSKLYIIGADAPDGKDRAYIQKLRDTYRMAIWFRWYSFEDNKLSDEI